MEFGFYYSESNFISSAIDRKRRKKQNYTTIQYNTAKRKASTDFRTYSTYSLNPIYQITSISTVLLYSSQARITDANKDFNFHVREKLQTNYHELSLICVFIYNNILTDLLVVQIEQSVRCVSVSGQ